MAIALDKAQELCDKTEWSTVVNSFPPRLGELAPNVLKKQANRVRRFLEQEQKSPGAEGRLALFEEALKRLEEARGEVPKDEAKVVARREKEKAAEARKKNVRDQRQDVRAKLQEKAEKEKAEKEGESKDDSADKPKKSGGRSVRAHLQAAGATVRQAKAGSRKV